MVHQPVSNAVCMPPFYNINTDSPPLLLLNLNCHSLTHLLSKIKSCRAKIHFSGALHSKQSPWILLNSFPVDRRSCRISVVAVPQEFWVAAPVVANEVCVGSRVDSQRPMFICFPRFVLWALYFYRCMTRTCVLYFIIVVLWLKSRKRHESSKL